MPTVVDSVQDSTSFPTRVDVVVIGAGVIGTCTAYELARAGQKVALLEKGVVAGEQSSRNWGYVRQQNRDLGELPLAMISLRRWAELDKESNRDLGFRRSGQLFLTRDPDELARWERWGAAARERGFHSDLLTAAEANARVPTTGTAWVGGVWSETDARAEPSMAVPAIAEGAKQAGVLLHQSCAVRGLDIANGRVTGVITEKGRIAADKVVLAGGAWSARLCRRHGVELPVANIGGTAIQTTVADEVVDAGCFYHADLAIRRRIDGSYTVAVPGHGVLNIAPQGIRNATKFYKLFRSKLSKKLKYRLNGSFFNGPEAFGGWQDDEVSPFEKIRVLDPAPDAELVDLALKRFVQVFPKLEGIGLARAWSGMIDTTPDLVPVIDALDDPAGLVVASGFSGHGFGIGPGAGMLVADLVLGRPPVTDPRPFRLGRFADLSQLATPEMM